MNDGMVKQLSQMLDSLSEHGWAVMPNAISKESCRALSLDLNRHQDAGDFRDASVGRGDSKSQESSIRSDSIHWLGASDPEVSIQDWLLEMKDLSESLNQNFFLSLNEYECHFACYEPGAFYLKHLDRFQNNSERIISVVLFLNDGWLKVDAGELLIYDREDSSLITAEISPEAGSLVLFQSDKIFHEVRKTNRRRLSVAGWLRSNTGAL
ncbi:MAG: hypothetical protein EOP07_14610 [Proteobacteria bacterium]|nr:MAG: hypothetical protein EOP07_14610 [Pseudomonadota bacterium]